jgi:hypothetical protein
MGVWKSASFADVIRAPLKLQSLDKCAAAVGCECFGRERQRFAAVGTMSALGAVCVGGVEHYANEPRLPIVW